MSRDNQRPLAFDHATLFKPCEVHSSDLNVWRSDRKDTFMASNGESASRIIASLDLKEFGQVTELEPSYLVGQACDEHPCYRSNGEDLRHEVDLTAALGLICLPEDYLVLRVAEVGPCTHERYIKFLSLVKQLGRLNSAFYFSRTD